MICVNELEKLKSFDPATELFGLFKKNANPALKTLTDEEVEEANTKYSSHISKMIMIANKIIRKPIHKLAAKGFEVHNNKDDINYSDKMYVDAIGKEVPAMSFSLVDWDLWDIYPDARTRMQDDNLNEYYALYNEIANEFKDYLKQNHLPGYIEEGGDWDGGAIVWIIIAKDV